MSTFSRTLLLGSILAALTGFAHAGKSDARAPLSCASGQPQAPSTATRDDSEREDDGLRIAGLTDDGRLVCFSERKPGKLRVVASVNGLQGDPRLVGIDYRVQDGKLYGVGDAGGVYAIDADTAVATFVNRLSVALDGSRFGVDFNPAADRLRIVSNTGQNLRHNLAGSTLADGTLNYTATATPGPAALGVSAAAYTNNDLSPATPATTGTTLFVLDATLDQIALQSPPNVGTLVATGKLTLDASALSGFDIYSTVRDNVTVRNRALATLADADGTVGLYHIDVLTGKASSRGKLPAGTVLIDIAVPLYQD